jgi:hypothetical protein
MASAVLAPEVVEQHVLHVQRRIFRGEDLALEDCTAVPGEGGGNHNQNGLDVLLFQPIAGDAAGNLPVHAVNGLLEGLQFGMLDLHGLERMSVVTVTNGACAGAGLAFFFPGPRATSSRVA